MLLSYVLAGLAFFGASQAATIQVSVGANHTITFSPPNVTAAVGDTVLFTFMGGDHNVVSSTFASPCTPSGNISSPFFLVASGATNFSSFPVVVNTTAPIWLYCAQVGHCQGGMVAAINAPTTGNTFDLFQQIAEGKAAAPSSASSVTRSVSPSGTGASSSPSASSTAKSAATLTRDVSSIAAVLVSFASAVFGLMI